MKWKRILLWTGFEFISWLLWSRKYPDMNGGSAYNKFDCCWIISCKKELSMIEIGLIDGWISKGISNRKKLSNSYRSSVSTSVPNFAFSWEIWNIFSSTESVDTNLITFTSRVCPIRWQRSSACLSIEGLKSLSWMITVSAPVRLRPSPPERVVRRNTLESEIIIIIINESTWLDWLY